MALKLTSRQQAQLAYLQTLPPRFQKIHATIELMAVMQADDVVVRQMIRSLEEIKSGAGQLSISGVADSAGNMAMLARRGGGLQMKVRGLRELLGSLKVNYEGALKAVTTPVAEDAPEAGPPGQPG